MHISDSEGFWAHKHTAVAICNNYVYQICTMYHYPLRGLYGFMCNWKAEAVECWALYAHLRLRKLLCPFKYTSCHLQLLHGSSEIIYANTLYTCRIWSSTRHSWFQVELKSIRLSVRSTICISQAKKAKKAIAHIKIDLLPFAITMQQ